MTNEKEKNWDNMYNEGAEGFNPYRDSGDGEPMWSKVESRLSKIQRLLNGIGNESFDQERKAALLAEQAELKTVWEKIQP